MDGGKVTMNVWHVTIQTLAFQQLVMIGAASLQTLNPMPTVWICSMHKVQRERERETERDRDRERQRQRERERERQRQRERQRERGQDRIGLDVANKF